jgi:hypothetical protein
MLLDIGQIDGVTFHQKLDCRPKDQESVTKIANTSKAFMASPPRFQNRILTTIFRARWAKHGSDADQVPLGIVCVFLVAHPRIPTAIETPGSRRAN